MEAKFCTWLSPSDRVELGGGPEHAAEAGLAGSDGLMGGDGAGVTAIVRALGKTKKTAYRWRDRYIERGIAGLKRDASRPGRKKPLRAAVIARVVDMTLHEQRPAATHWTARTLAKAVGLSHTSVQRIWAAHGL